MERHIKKLLMVLISVYTVSGQQTAVDLPPPPMFDSSLDASVHTDTSGPLLDAGVSHGGSDHSVSGDMGTHIPADIMPMNDSFDMASAGHTQPGDTMDINAVLDFNMGDSNLTVPSDFVDPSLAVFNDTADVHAPAHIGPPDAFAPPIDAFAPPIDAFAPPSDAFAPPPDAFAPPPLPEALTMTTPLPAGSAAADTMLIAAAAGDSIGDAVGGAVENMADAAGGAVDTMADAASGVVENVADAAGGVVDTMADTVGGVVENVADAAGGVVEHVADAASGVVENVADAATGAIETMADTAGNVIENVADAGGGAVDTMADAASGVVENIADVATGAVENIADAASGAIDTITDGGGDAAATLMAVDAMANAGTGTGPSHMDATGGAMDSIAPLVVADAMGDGGVMENVADAASGAVDTLTDGGENLATMMAVDAMANGGAGTGAALEGAAGGAMDGIANLVVADAISDGGVMENVADAASGVVDTLTDGGDNLATVMAADAIANAGAGTGAAPVDRTGGVMDSIAPLVVADAMADGGVMENVADAASGVVDTLTDGGENLAAVMAADAIVNAGAGAAPVDTTGGVMDSIAPLVVADAMGDGVGGAVENIVDAASGAVDTLTDGGDNLAAVMAADAIANAGAGTGAAPVDGTGGVMDSIAPLVVADAMADGGVIENMADAASGVVDTLTDGGDNLGTLMAADVIANAGVGTGPAPVDTTGGVMDSIAPLVVADAMGDGIGGAVENIVDVASGAVDTLTDGGENLATVMAADAIANVGAGPGSAPIDGTGGVMDSIAPLVVADAIADNAGGVVDTLSDGLDGGGETIATVMAADAIANAGAGQAPVDATGGVMDTIAPLVVADAIADNAGGLVDTLSDGMDSGGETIATVMAADAIANAGAGTGVGATPVDATGGVMDSIVPLVATGAISDGVGDVVENIADASSGENLATVLAADALANAGTGVGAGTGMPVGAAGGAMDSLVPLMAADAIADGAGGVVENVVDAASGAIDTITDGFDGGAETIATVMAADAFANGGTGAGQAHVDMAGGAMDSIIPLMAADGAVENIADAAGSAVDTITDGVDGGSETIATVMAADAIANADAGAGQAPVDAAGGAMDGIVPLLVADKISDSGVVDTLTDGIDGGAETIATVMAADAIANAGVSAGPAHVDAVGGAMDGIVPLLAADGAMENIADAAGGVVENVVDGVGDDTGNLATVMAADAIANAGAGTGPTPVDATGGTMDSIIPLVVADGSSDVVENILDTAGDVVEKVADTASDVVEKVADVAGNVVETVVDTTGDVVEKVADAASGVVETITDRVGDETGKVVTVMAADAILNADAGAPHTIDSFAPPPIMPSIFDIHGEVNPADTALAPSGIVPALTLPTNQTDRGSPIQENPGIALSMDNAFAPSLFENMDPLVFDVSPLNDTTQNNETQTGTQAKTQPVGIQTNGIALPGTLRLDLNDSNLPTSGHTDFSSITNIPRRASTASIVIEPGIAVQPRERVPRLNESQIGESQIIIGETMSNDSSPNLILESTIMTTAETTTEDPIKYTVPVHPPPIFSSGLDSPVIHEDSGISRTFREHITPERKPFINVVLTTTTSPPPPIPIPAPNTIPSDRYAPSGSEIPTFVETLKGLPVETNPKYMNVAELANLALQKTSNVTNQGGYSNAIGFQVFFKTLKPITRETTLSPTTLPPPTEMLDESHRFVHSSWNESGYSLEKMPSVSTKSINTGIFTTTPTEPPPTPQPNVPTRFNYEITHQTNTFDKHASEPLTRPNTFQQQQPVVQIRPDVFPSLFEKQSNIQYSVDTNARKQPLDQRPKPVTSEMFGPRSRQFATRNAIFGKSETADRPKNNMVTKRRIVQPLATSHIVQPLATPFQRDISLTTESTPLKSIFDQVSNKLVFGARPRSYVYGDATSSPSENRLPKPTMKPIHRQPSVRDLFNRHVQETYRHKSTVMGDTSSDLTKNVQASSSVRALDNTGLVQNQLEQKTHFSATQYTPTIPPRTGSEVRRIFNQHISPTFAFRPSHWGAPKPPVRLQDVHRRPFSTEGAPNIPSPITHGTIINISPVAASFQSTPKEISRPSIYAQFFEPSKLKRKPSAHTIQPNVINSNNPNIANVFGATDIRPLHGNSFTQNASPVNDPTLPDVSYMIRAMTTPSPEIPAMTTTTTRRPTTTPVPTIPPTADPNPPPIYDTKIRHTFMPFPTMDLATKPPVRANESAQGTWDNSASGSNPNFPDQCRRCVFVNDRCLLPDPVHCNMYTECVRQGPMVRAFQRDCALGSFFDRKSYLCVDPKNTDCPTDRCREPNRKWYPIHGHCKHYWSCQAREGGGIYAQSECCPDMGGFDEEFGCVENPNCTETCSVDISRNPPKGCHLRKTSSKTVYFDANANMERPCAPGTLFNELQCTCVQDVTLERNASRPGGTPCTCGNETTCACRDALQASIGAGTCSPMLALTFDQGNIEDTSNTKQHIGIEGVPTSPAGQAIFTGSGRLVLWRYANLMFPLVFAVRLRFQTSRGGSQLQTLIANCDKDGVHEPTFHVYVDTKFHEVVFQVNTYESVSKVFKIIYQDKGWSDVVLIYDGERIVGSVDGRSRNILAGGGIETRPYPLSVGTCGKKQGFRGLIDDIHIYEDCIPDDMYGIFMSVLE